MRDSPNFQALNRTGGQALTLGSTFGDWGISLFREKRKREEGSKEGYVCGQLGDEIAPLIPFPPPPPSHHRSNRSFLLLFTWGRERKERRSL